ncbi:MAG: 2-hydroxyacid dehydrogenase [Mycoplasma sp.]|nr:2-hydroxyacid dehydrogenase [Mycoplasma sp.]
MRIALFDAKEYDKEFFEKENNKRHQITYFEENLSLDNLEKAKGFDAVCGFVNTPAETAIIEELSNIGIKFWLQRSMGYNRIDLNKAKEKGIEVFRVPNYSAETVSEHAVALMMAVNRRLVKAKTRTSKCDFTLNGLQGKCINNSTVGVIGSGKIGQGFISAVKGMGANIIVFDEFAQKNFPDTATKLGFKWVDKDELLTKSDFISIHAPLLPTTKHMIDDEAINKMKDGMILINCARGPLVDTTALIKGLKSGKIAGAGLDVIEREEGRFFFDRKKDEVTIKTEDLEWKYLLEHEDVIVTAHQAFFSDLALKQIASVTLSNADDAEKGDFSKALKIQEDGKVLNG